MQKTKILDPTSRQYKDPLDGNDGDNLESEKGRSGRNGRGSNAIGGKKQERNDGRESSEREIATGKRRMQ